METSLCYVCVISLMTAIIMWWLNIKPCFWSHSPLSCSYLLCLLCICSVIYSVFIFAMYLAVDICTSSPWQVDNDPVSFLGVNFRKITLVFFTQSPDLKTLWHPDRHTDERTDISLFLFVRIGTVRGGGRGLRSLQFDPIRLVSFFLSAMQNIGF